MRWSERNAVESKWKGERKNIMLRCCHSVTRFADLMADWRNLGTSESLLHGKYNETRCARSLISNLGGDPALGPLRKDNVTSPESYVGQ